VLELVLATNTFAPAVFEPVALAPANFCAVFLPATALFAPVLRLPRAGIFAAGSRFTGAPFFTDGATAAVCAPALSLSKSDNPSSILKARR
jgi:hypothetical protein